MKRLLLVFAVVFLGLGTLLAQERTIEGTITDTDGESLIGANVIVKGKTIGTATDILGKYEINVPSGSNILIFSYTGYGSKEVELGASNVVDVVLSEGITLEAAVVTALGVRRDEKALGYAVQEVGSEDINKSNTTSFVDALSGKAAGVHVTQSSGAAGAGSRVVLRGQTSFNGNNEALIVVDGVRLDNTEKNSERGLNGVANSNRGIDLNPNDIESVTVLKGAAAAALYGVEGARGVLVITTKKGKANKGIEVNFSSTFTMTEVSQMPKFQDQYVQGVSGAWLGPETGWLASWGPRADTLAYDGSDYKHDKNGRLVGQNDPTAGAAFTPYNNVDDFYQNGSSFNNNLSFSGGNDKMNYRFSFGHLRDNGVVPNNTFNRTNVGLNVGVELSKKLNASMSINYVRSGGVRIQQGSNTSGVNLGLFRTPISFDNSNGLSNPVDDPSSYTFPDNSQRNYRGGGGYDNPYWVVNLAQFNDRVNRMFGSLNLSYELADWMTFSTTIGTDFYTDNRTQEFELGSRTFPNGQVFEDQFNYRHTDIYFNVLGNVNLTSDFTLGYNLGVNLWNKFDKNNYIQGDGLNFFGFRELGNTSAIVSAITHNNQRSAAIFGSVDLGFKNYLYLTLTGRNDWVSTLIAPSKPFSAGDIAVFYPSASLSFVFSEVMDFDPLSFGKVRLSYAQVGGGAPTSYSTATIYNVPNNTTTIYSLNDGWTNGILFPFQGSSGFTYSPIEGNPNLIPSTTTDYEIGLDLRFFNNRIGLDATYYTRKSSDQIIAINIPNTTGFQRAFINAGELQTVGTELVLNLTPIRKPNFSWDIAFNFSKWKTTVESLPEGVQNQYLDGFTGTGIYNLAPDAQGNKFQFGQILGGAFQHVNAADGKSFDPNLPYNPDGALVIDDSGSSDVNAADYNPNYGFPLVDPNNRVIGNPNPDFLLGINNTLTYKNFSLSFLFDIKQGGEIWNGTKGALTFFGMTELTESRDATTAAGLPDYENATFVYEGLNASDGSANSFAVPLDENWYLGNGGGFGAVAEHFVEDASYYRLRLVNLSYTFNNKIFGNAPIRDLTISFTGRNLFLWTPYTGVDPETSLVGSSSNGQGLEYFQMPGIRSYAVGLNVKF